MSCSIITLKLILATVGIIDPLKCLSTVRKWKGARRGSTLALLLALHSGLHCLRVTESLGTRGTFSNSDSELTLPKHSALSQKWRTDDTPVQLSYRHQTMSYSCCHIQSAFWQDGMQVPGWREPQLELKPIHQSCKRLSGSTVQVPLTGDSILHPHILPFCE